MRIAPEREEPNLLRGTVSFGLKVPFACLLLSFACSALLVEGG